MTATLDRQKPATEAPKTISARKSRPKPGAAPWTMAAAIFLAICGTALGLSGVVRGGSWFLVLAITVGLVLAAMALSRALRLASGWAPAFGLVALILQLTFVFFNQTAYLGFIPSPASFSALGELFGQASDAVIRGVAPIPATPSVVFVICLGVGLAAILTDVLAVGLLMPATSGLALVVVALIPALVKVDSLGVLGFVFGISGYLLILALSRRMRPESLGIRSSIQWGRVLGLGAIALVFSLVVSMLLPGFSTGTFPQGSRFNPFGPVAGLSPFLSLGSDLRNPSGTGQINYATTASSAPYLRTVTIEDFTGESWQPTDRGNLSQLGDGMISNEFAASEVNITTTTTQINAYNFSNQWLPTPYAPSRISGLSGRWNVDAKTLTLKAVDQDTLGQSYTVVSSQPQLTPEILRKAISRPKTGFDPIFMALPQNTPSIVRETALEITGRQPTPYDKAMAIQQYLRSAAFSYSLQAPVSGGYDGSSMDALAKFLEVKSGYCVHFSSAMAIMAREAGIPSRIAVGFAPGTPTGENQEVDGQQLARYTVDGRLAHAWPELYFEGLGWVPFEPTPSRGEVPDYAQQRSAPLPSDVVPTEEPRPTASKPSSQPAAAPLPSATPGAQNEGFNLLWFVLPALLLLVLLTPALSRLSLRRRRELAGTPLGLWSELQDTAVDYGLPPDGSDTPRRFASRLRDSGLAGTPGPELGSLLQEVERSSYGPPENSVASKAAATELGQSRESFRLLSPLRQRLSALLLPASMLRRWAGWLTRPFRRRH